MFELLYTVAEHYRLGSVFVQGKFILVAVSNPLISPYTSYLDMVATWRGKARMATLAPMQRS